MDKCAEHSAELPRKALEFALAISEAERAAKRANDASNKAYKLVMPEFDESGG